MTSARENDGVAHKREGLPVILCSALELAGWLGLQTVAEGIESLADWRLLQEYGCTFAQGSLLANPMPATDFETWLKNHLARRGELRAKETSPSSGR
ncbi:MAG TPA: EAL domain-containing protein [Steroidobacteraceae bacterium]|nr:EAL domain-containing protein [Steroidobacteraceae bacterium]